MKVKILTNIALITFMLLTGRNASHGKERKRRDGTFQVYTQVGVKELI